MQDDELDERQRRIRAQQRQMTGGWYVGWPCVGCSQPIFFEWRVPDEGTGSDLFSPRDLKLEEMCEDCGGKCKYAVTDLQFFHLDEKLTPRSGAN